MTKKLIIAGAALLLVLFFVFGSSIFEKQQESKLEGMARDNAATFVRDYSKTLGSDEAKVTLVEFLDPGCETCATFYPFVKRLMMVNPGRIKLVIRYAPFHPGSDYIVKILEASRAQGKYWETLEVIYNAQPYWASHGNPQVERIWEFLPQAGLDLEKIRKDMADPEFARRIEQDVADAKALGVRQTPEFFVNSRPLPSFGYKELQALVDSEIRANY